jgi:signal peptidase II
MRRRSSKTLLACALATVALVALDLGTKAWASETLSVERVAALEEVCHTDERGFYRYQRARRPPQVLVDGYLDLEYAENCGAAFGFLRAASVWTRRVVFGTAAVGAIGVLFWMLFAGSGGVLFQWAVPLVAAGAVGNLADRIRLGYVVDFIHFHWRGEWEYPTFNVADITITIGVALLVIDGIRSGAAAAEEEGEGSEDAEDAEDAEEGQPKKGKKGRSGKPKGKRGKKGRSGAGFQRSKSKKKKSAAAAESDESESDESEDEIDRAEEEESMADAPDAETDAFEASDEDSEGGQEDGDSEE